MLQEEFIFTEFLPMIPLAMQDVRLDGESGFVSKGLSEKKNVVQSLLTEVDKLASVFDNFPDESPEKNALYAQETVKQAMESARVVADRLEGLVDHRLWPIPTYSEILHDHQ